MAKLNSYKRHFFYEIQYTAEYRWNPIKISSFFIITLLVNAIFLAYPFYFLVVRDEASSLVTEIIGKLTPIMLGFHLLCVLFYHNAKRSMKYQTLQTYVFPIIMFTFGVSPLFMYWLMCDIEWLTDIYYIIGIFIFLIGICLIIYGYFTLIRDLKMGELQRHKPSRKNGVKPKVIHVNEKALRIGIVFTAIIGMYIFTILTGVIPHVFVFMLVSVCIYLPVCAMIPELFLLAYCKKRFPSFHQTLDEK